MAARVEMIGVSDGLAFAPLFTAVTSEDVLVVVVVEVLVLVEIRLGHSSRDWIVDCVRRIQVADVRRKSNGNSRWFRLDYSSTEESVRYWLLRARRPVFIYAAETGRAYAHDEQRQF